LTGTPDHDEADGAVEPAVEGRVGPAAPLFPRGIVWIMPSLAALLAAIGFAFAFSSPLPYGDEYALADVLTGHSPLSWEYLWSQHNEHRLPVSRLILHALLPAVHYDFRVAAAAVPLVVGLGTLGLAWTLARRRGGWLWTDSMPSLLLLSFGHAECFMMGFLLQYALTVALTLGVLAACAGRSAAAAALLLLVLPGTGVNGVLMSAALWPVFALVFCVGTRPLPRGLALAAVLAGVLTLVAYFRGLERGEWVARSWQSFLGSLLAVLSLDWGPAAARWWPVLGPVAGLFSLVASGWIAVRAAAGRRPELLAAPAVVACTGLYAAAIAGLRDHADAAAGAQPRYALLMGLGPVAVWWACGLLAGRTARRTRQVLTVVAAVVWVAHVSGGLDYGRRYAARRGALQADLAAGMPLRCLAEKYHRHPFGLFNPSAEFLYDRLVNLRPIHPALRDAVVSPPCRRVELPGPEATLDEATGQMVLVHPLEVHALSWTWRLADSEQPVGGTALIWQGPAGSVRPATFRGPVGPSWQRESVVVDGPVHRLGFTIAGNGPQLQVAGIVLHVRADAPVGKEPAARDAAGCRGVAPRRQAGKGFCRPGSASCQRVGQRQPSAVGAARRHRLLDELHPLHPVADVGIHGVHPLERASRESAGHGVEAGAVDIRERLEEGLGMARRQAAGGPARVVGEAGVGVAGVELVRPAVVPHEHPVGLLLVPLQAAEGAVDLDPQVVLAAVADL